MAVLGGWSGHCKLVHLTTRLRGAAYSFYRSCSLEQRSDYTLLAEELKKRFTPVKLAAVQSQLFHDRKQGPKESVDEFAQDLKKLFARAYAGVNRGGPEAEKMGQSVLANQFIAGLCSDLKSKVVGVEGSLEQLLLKARFEEAKKRELRELSLRTLPPPQKKLPVSGSGSTPRTTPATQNPPWRAPPANVGTSRACFNCGMTGHLAQACPYPRQLRKEREAHGRKEPAIANVRTGEDEQLEERILELKKELHAAEMRIAAGSVSAVMHHISEDGNPGSGFGPTVVAMVKVNGVEAAALVDTGSPVTIVSLRFAMEVMAKEIFLSGGMERRLCRSFQSQGLL